MRKFLISQTHLFWKFQFHFSHSVLSDSLQYHELQHAKASLFISNFRSQPKLTSIESVMSSNHLILCPPLLLLTSIFPRIRVSSKWVSSSYQVAKLLNFSFNISLTNEHPGLIPFRMVWLDLLAVQGNFQSILQHHSSQSSILWCSAFFIVQLYFSQV